jgi:hypothetical protein
VNNQDLRDHRREADRHEIAIDVERELVVELRIDRVRRQGEQNVVAVRGRLCRNVGANVAGGATAIVNDDRLTQFRSQRFVHDAGDHVGAPTRRVGHDEANGLVRIVLRHHRHRCDERKGSSEERRQSRVPELHGRVLPAVGPALTGPGFGQTFSHDAGGGDEGRANFRRQCAARD